MSLLDLSVREVVLKQLVHTQRGMELIERPNSLLDYVKQQNKSDL